MRFRWGKCLGLWVAAVFLCFFFGQAEAQTGSQVQPFWQKVEGGYVGSYRTRAMAERQATGLTQKGWPASVVEGEAGGQKWYRVYLNSPGQSPSGTGGAGVNFEIVVDLSRTGGPGKYGCYGRSKYESMMGLLRKINGAVPPPNRVAALREARMGGTAGQSAPTNVLFGPAAFSRESYGGALGRLQPSNGDAPLGFAMAGSDYELRAMPSPRALILLSDFDPDRDLALPVQRSQALKARYPDLCVYTVYFGEEDRGVQMARQIALASGCGNFYDGCLLIGDPTYFEGMIRRVFFGLGCPDSDKDGICDDSDECPGTPLGAPVDRRGCWVAAFEQYFDFNKSVVKKKYLPNLRQAATILRLNPDQPVIIAGHTDNVGSYGYNLDLGAKRADAVRQVLISYGVPPSQMKIRSYGETRPIADNRTAAGRARNRRVEFDSWTQKPYY